MSIRVHQPRTMKPVKVDWIIKYFKKLMILSNLHCNISPCIKVEWRTKTSIKNVHRQWNRNDQVADWHQHPKILPLKCTNWISFQITHVNLLSKFLHIWMLLAHQPSHMCEKESSRCTVWICICVCKLMMWSMISRPFIDAVLECNCLEECEENLECCISFEGTMSP
jgi:hypothetical protein